MADAPLFKRLSLLYFAVAELQRSGAAPRTAGAGARISCSTPIRRSVPSFRRARALALTAPQGAVRDGLLDRIDRAIEPFDTAGLLDRTRRDWYPVLPADLLGAAAKLDATVDEVQRLLERCGFVRPATPGLQQQRRRPDDHRA